MHVSLFWLRNPLTSNGRITVNSSCIGEGFEPKSPLTNFGRIVIKPEEALVVLL